MHLLVGDCLRSSVGASKKVWNLLCLLKHETLCPGILCFETMNNRKCLQNITPFDGGGELKRFKLLCGDVDRADIQLMHINTADSTHSNCTLKGERLRRNDDWNEPWAVERMAARRAS